MMKGKTDIVMVLDRSGSMSGCQDATIKGFNEFIEAQKKEPGEATLTLAQFDDVYEIVHNGVALADVPALTSTTFVPRATTALLDAIGKTINATGQRLSAMPEEDRPEKVLFVIITDGFENASKEYQRDQVLGMITEQRDTYKWEFVFIGANADAIASATAMGIPLQNVVKYTATPEGTQCAYAGLTARSSAFRRN
jgi:uncharacterized protein YegL